MGNVLSFLRRARRVASVIAPMLAVATVVFAAQSQPAKQIEPGRSQNPAATQNKPDAIPPINITVTAPDKSTEEKAAERNRSERQDAMNERIAQFTFWLVIVGAGQAVATAFAFWASWRAANAAKKSADTGERSLRLLHRPWLDTSTWGSYPVFGTADDFGTLPTVGIVVVFNIINNSATPARINWIQTTDTLTQNEESRAVETVLTPGGIFRCQHEIPFPVTPEALSDYDSDRGDRGLVVDIRGFIHYSDMFSPPQPSSPVHVFGPRVRRFGRRCLLRRHGSSFDIPTGAEDVGVNDEDWNQ